MEILLTYEAYIHSLFSFHIQRKVFLLGIENSNKKAIEEIKIQVRRILPIPLMLVPNDKQNPLFHTNPLHIRQQIVYKERKHAHKIRLLVRDNLASTTLQFLFNKHPIKNTDKTYNSINLQCIYNYACTILRNNLISNHYNSTQYNQQL